jgi:hypothetical protein
MEIAKGHPLFATTFSLRPLLYFYPSLDLAIFTNAIHPLARFAITNFSRCHLHHYKFFEHAYIVQYDLLLSSAKPCSCYYTANHYAFLFGVICDLHYVHEFKKLVE